MTLAEKLDLVGQRVAALLTDHALQRIAVAWTGGKDSTLTLALFAHAVRQAGLPGAVRALSIDTGRKYPETVAFRKRIVAEGTFGPLENLTVRPAAGLALAHPPLGESGEGQGVADPVACCAALKVAPLAKGVAELGAEVLVTGLRADEHPERRTEHWLEARDLGGRHVLMAQPILQFTEMDVWTATARLGLPVCELYARGYRSLGCVPCTAPPEAHAAGAERAGRDQAKEARMAELKALGYF